VVAGVETGVSILKVGSEQLFGYACRNMGIENCGSLKRARTVDWIVKLMPKKIEVAHERDGLLP